MFNQLSPVLLGLVFVAAAAVVWFASPPGAGPGGPRLRRASSEGPVRRAGRLAPAGRGRATGIATRVRPTTVAPPKRRLKNDATDSSSLDPPNAL